MCQLRDIAMPTWIPAEARAAPIGPAELVSIACCVLAYQTHRHPRPLSDLLKVRRDHMPKGLPGTPQTTAAARPYALPWCAGRTRSPAESG